MFDGFCIELDEGDPPGKLQVQALMFPLVEVEKSL
jgi:hypothetical protein